MTTPNNEQPIGRIAGIFGIRGELKCDPTLSGRNLFEPGASLRCVLASGRDITVHVRATREHKGRLLIALEEAADATAAEAYVGATFFAPREALDVAPDEYLDVDLVGCRVEREDGHLYGEVRSVEHYPASDMLMVKGRMLPMVRAFIRAIDIPHRRIVVDVPPGLLDDDAETA